MIIRMDMEEELIDEYFPILNYPNTEKLLINLDNIHPLSTDWIK